RADTNLPRPLAEQVAPAYRRPTNHPGRTRGSNLNRSFRIVAGALALLAVGLATPAWSQQAGEAPAPAAAAPAAPPAPAATTTVILHTAMGDIHVALETQRAPVTAANFLKYVDE